MNYLQTNKCTHNFIEQDPTPLTYTINKKEGGLIVKLRIEGSSEELVRKIIKDLS